MGEDIQRGFEQRGILEKGSCSTGCLALLLPVDQQAEKVTSGAPCPFPEGTREATMIDPTPPLPSGVHLFEESPG